MLGTCAKIERRLWGLYATIDARLAILTFHFSTVFAGVNFSISYHHPAKQDCLPSYKIFHSILFKYITYMEIGVWSLK